MQSFVVITSLLLSLASALAITEPNATTVWSASGGSNYISWAQYPLTYPAIKSNLVQIWLRQNTGLFESPLNASLVPSLDTLQHTSLSFNLSGQLPAGPGYQLFFSPPGDSSIVYCESPSFSIVANTSALPATPNAHTTLSGVVTVSSSTPTATGQAARPTFNPHGLGQTPGGPSDQFLNVVVAPSNARRNIGAMASSLGIISVGSAILWWLI